MDYNTFSNNYNIYQQRQNTMFTGYPVEISRYGGKPKYQVSGPKPPTSTLNPSQVTINAQAFINYLNTLGPVRRKRAEKAFSKGIVNTYNASNNTINCNQLDGIDKIRCQVYVKNMEENKKHIAEVDAKYNNAIRVAAISKGLASTASMLTSLFANRNLPNPVLQQTNPKLNEVVRNLKNAKENAKSEALAQTHSAYDAILKSGLTNPLTAILATHVNSINGLNKLLPAYDTGITNANIKLGENEAAVANANANTINKYGEDARNQRLEKRKNTLEYGNEIAAIPSEVFNELLKKEASVTVPLETIAKAYPYAPIANYGGKKLHRRKKC